MCLADTCAPEVNSVFSPVAPYGYLLYNMYLFTTDIANPDFCLLLLDLDQRQASSVFAWPACPKNGKSGPQCWGREGSTQFAQEFVTAVTAPPLVDGVVWSPIKYITAIFNLSVTTCQIPWIWKASLVITIRKPGKDTSLRISYKPFSVLCSAAKVLESLILHTINKYLQPATDQHGLRPDHSTTSALLQLTTYIAIGFN